MQRAEDGVDELCWQSGHCPCLFSGLRDMLSALDVSPWLRIFSEDDGPLSARTGIELGIP